MLIAKLEMELDMNLLLNPVETTYHLTEDIAEDYYSYQMRTNPNKYTSEFWITGVEINEKSP